MNYSIMEEKIGTSAHAIMNCIDAGSENCPCYLAVTGDCLTCSRLQGKEYCDCNWKGVCIYNEFVQGNRRVNNPRKDFEAAIIERKFYKEDLVVYVLDVGKGFAMKASRPGSYLFVKSNGASNYYDVPISVMRADVEKGQIHLAIKIISSKTKALLAETERLIIRGPYRNGLQGIAPIMRKRSRDQKALIIAKGIGMAPGILATRFFRNKGSIDLMIDTEKISKELIGDYLDGDPGIEVDNNLETLEGTIKYFSLAEKGAEKELEKQMKKRQYDSVIVLASDYYIETLGKLIKKILPEADLAVSNNFHICCGEGLCGSCSVDTVEGDTIKMCKCQLTGQALVDNLL